MDTDYNDNMNDEISYSSTTNDEENNSQSSSSFADNLRQEIGVVRKLSKDFTLDYPEDLKKTTENKEPHSQNENKSKRQRTRKPVQGDNTQFNK